MRRRVTGNNAVLNPLMGGKAHSKDPRNFRSGNVPGQQWDIEQFTADRIDLDRNVPQISEMTRRVHNAGADTVAQTLPTRIQYTRWTLDGLSPATGQNPITPCLLVPKNPLRVAIELGSQYFALVATDQMILHYCWGTPLITTTAPPLSRYGHVLAPGEVLRYAGGVCPIDELWVWNLNASNVAYVAFEGIAVPEANQL